jgi:hypothetical protein
MSDVQALLDLAKKFDNDEVDQGVIDALAVLSQSALDFAARQGERPEVVPLGEMESHLCHVAYVHIFRKHMPYSNLRAVLYSAARKMSDPVLSVDEAWDHPDITRLVEAQLKGTKRAIEFQAYRRATQSFCP